MDAALYLLPVCRNMRAACESSVGADHAPGVWRRRAQESTRAARARSVTAACACAHPGPVFKSNMLGPVFGAA